MSLESLIQIKKAISSLNPKQVRELSRQEVTVALHAPDGVSLRGMEEYLLADLDPARRSDSAGLILRNPSEPGRADVDLYHVNALAPPRSLIYRPDRPDIVVEKALAEHPGLGLPLSRSFLPFRKPYVKSVISSVSRENTLFSLATALPDVIPTIIELPWAVAEFASDSAFLTMNQIRMAFLIAGASDREVGYRDQKSEIAAVIGSAFGWRALARQLIGKIPFGGGLIAKAGVAYAGTKVLGVSLDTYYGLGYRHSREERERLYQVAFTQGKNVALRLLRLLRPDLADRLLSKSAPVPASR